MSAAVSLRVGLVGAGSMGWQHAAGWQQTSAKLVGVFAADRAGAERLARDYGAAVYDDLDALLSQVDVLDICAPTPVHREYVERAAAAKKHIYCEKPIARNHADG